MYDNGRTCWYLLMHIPQKDINWYILLKKKGLYRQMYVFVPSQWPEFPLVCVVVFFVLILVEF
jgi:hypothetical protein